ncbi:MAG: hypothetical protein SFU99_05720 [Saprospiraceae bacterium]|nr:hypothetical protein [Saprospiraceae bacterium]
MKIGNRKLDIGNNAANLGFAKLFLICSLTSSLSCRNEPQITPAFYHWQTQFSLSQKEQAYLDSLSAEKLYTKFFDIEWDATQEMPIPLAEVEIRNWGIGELGNRGIGSPAASLWRPKEIVPTIFITNQTFQNLSQDKIEWLAARVDEKLQELWHQLPDQTLHEVQFDCDWTASTKDSFFQFIEIFKSKNTDIQISATIRLHQIRDYKTTGVPPVDRGMLMFYNTGDVEDWQENNSILNIEIAQNYLPTSNFQLPTSKVYPMPLDIALPIFAWGVLFRDGRMIRLINNLRSEQLTDTTRFQKMTNNRFEVTKSTYLEGYYLYQGDQIRTETIDTTLLHKAADLIKNRLKNRDLTVAFYHLDTATIKYFPHDVLESVCEKFISN